MQSVHLIWVSLRQSSKGKCPKRETQMKAILLYWSSSETMHFVLFCFALFPKWQNRGFARMPNVLGNSRIVHIHTVYFSPRRNTKVQHKSKRKLCIWGQKKVTNSLHSRVQWKTTSESPVQEMRRSLSMIHIPTEEAGIQATWAYQTLDAFDLGSSWATMHTPRPRHQ